MKRVDPALAEDFLSLQDPEGVLESATRHFESIKQVFDNLGKTRAMELLRHNKERAKYLLNYHCRVIACPVDQLLLNHQEILESKLKIGTLVLLEAAQLNDFETFGTVVASRCVKRVVLVGNLTESPPAITSRLHQATSCLHKSMFSRLAQLNYPIFKLRSQHRVSADVHSAIKSLYPDLQLIANPDQKERNTAGLTSGFQIIDVSCEEVRLCYSA